MLDITPNIEQLRAIWNTSSLDAFNKLNFDGILYPSNISGNETYIKLGVEKDAQIINGFKLLKKHKGQNTETLYFVPTEYINDLPIEIINTRKINYSKEVFNLVTDFKVCRIKPEQILSFRQLVDLSGCPEHTNPTHYKLYKMKCLYGRLKEQFYYRIISQSAFGKTKYKEMLRLLLNKMCIISDPTSAKLFFSICHNKDITLNEMPDTSNKQLFIKFCNMLMQIGDKTKMVENPSRKTDGTFENADTSKLSVCFTHNPPEYYKEKGMKDFENTFPYNVINRYYYNLYEGQTTFHQVYGYNAEKVAIENQQFIKDWIKTALWYEENWHKIKNPYPECLLDGFKFRDTEPRFKEHFKDFAKCVAEYSDGDMNLYVNLLIEEYKSHKFYDDLIHNTKQELEIKEINLINQKGEA